MTGPHPDPLALDAHLEPSALHAGFDVREPIVSALSQAVSLKRIADALEMLTRPSHDQSVEFTNLVQHIAWEAGRSFQQGTRTDR